MSDHTNGVTLDQEMLDAFDERYQSVSLFQRYVQERKAWATAGKPLRSDPRIEELFDKACQPCEHFRPLTQGVGRCEICGCFLRRSGLVANKLAWATTQCPDNPPRWPADVRAPVVEERQRASGAGCCDEKSTNGSPSG